MLLTDISRSFRNAVLAGSLTFYLGIGFAWAQDHGQKAEMRRIQQFQHEIDSVITHCVDQPEECPMYLDKVKTNDLNGSWPAVGIFQSEQKFWYRRTNEGEGSKELELLKVEVQTQRSNRTELEEYYFAQGGLVSYRFKLENGEESQEFRYLFWFGKLLDYWESITPGENDYRVLEEGAASQVKQWGNKMQYKFEINH